MTQQQQAADKRLNGTLRFADGRVSTDRSMQTLEGVKRALKDHSDLRVAKDILPAAETT